METTQNQHNFKFDESIYDDFQDGKGMEQKNSLSNVQNGIFSANSV